MKNDLLTDIRLDSLGLHESLQLGLEKAGFSHCTPVQAAALPILLQHRDVAAQAQTGTGKSAAFLLATMHYLMTTPVAEDKTGPWALILAPTRELALQIHRDAEELGYFTGMRCTAVYGGIGYEQQRSELEQGVDIIIGTPGRIIDFYKQRVFNLDNAEVVVLDEADRMFDMGFIADVRYLLRRMPPPARRINMLFSATLSERVKELAYEHMNAPEAIAIEPEQVTAEKVRQSLYHVASADKIGLLLGVLRRQDTTRTLVFVNTKRNAERVSGYLVGNGFEAEVISGDIPQKKREQLLHRFQEGKLPMLVATDVAARGLHIPDVSRIVNYDLPQNAEDYVHRIGRTARAGASGDAISFACEAYVYSLPEIEAYIHQKIPAEMASPQLIATDIKPPRRAQRRMPPQSGPQQGRNGRRSSQRPAAAKRTAKEDLAGS